ncbi:hypothetical protein [uncultured Mailhella sp.]|uniref:hypothetical protein n=1 Tax=uncultured Mailhella sp. TaxID=1981031 RepID=UPI003209294C
MDSSALVALPHQEWKIPTALPFSSDFDVIPSDVFWNFNGALIEVLKWIYRRKTQARKLDLLRMAESPPQAGHITIRPFPYNHAERKDYTKYKILNDYRKYICNWRFLL